ncbi:MAG: crossover junction endodeoxyribonuclease RuvC [Eubacteriales bacterium]|jgi:crossover junction endodeoxyribonuclease RuvC
MIILGVDPGIATIGTGVIKYEGNRFTTIYYDSIITPPKIPLATRLSMLYDELTRIIRTYRPEMMAVEELFFNNNEKTAIAVGQGRGVILLCGAQAGLPVFEYTPLQIKQAVVGYGRAEKKQVQLMTKMLLGLERVPKPDDTADALAVAICHAHSYNPNMQRQMMLR